MHWAITQSNSASVSGFASNNEAEGCGPLFNFLAIPAILAILAIRRLPLLANSPS
jgi:hypothetical protein